MLRFRIATERADEVMVAFNGVISEETKQIFRDGLATLGQARQGRAIIDFTEAGAKGVAFIGPLLVARRTLSNQDRQLCLKGCSEDLFGVLYSLKLHEVVHVLDPPPVDTLPWRWSTPGELLESVAEQIMRRKCRECPLRAEADATASAQSADTMKKAAE